jgi:hypothetical protein
VSIYIGTVSFKGRKCTSKQPKVYLIAAVIILVAWGSYKTVQTYQAHQLETQQLKQERQLLLEAKTKDETTKQQLIKQIEEKDKAILKLKQSKANLVSTAYAAPVKTPSGDCVKWITEAGIKDVSNAFILIGRESGCRWNATNASSGAYGIPQALPGTKMASAGADWKTNPVTQLRWMNGYVLARYHSWAGAVAFSKANGWY